VAPSSLSILSRGDTFRSPERVDPVMKAEIVRRRSLADQVEELFKARPGVWIPLAELARVGGTGGYRTRISELRLRKIDPMNIDHNGLNGARSCHRFLPHQPLGRDASHPAADRWPVFGAPYEDVFKLTPPEAR
jgi:hypothetical protein